MPDTPRPRVPKGKPLPASDADLEAASEISPADIEAAKDWWQRNSDPKCKLLLEAEPDDAE